MSQHEVLGGLPVGTRVDMVSVGDRHTYHVTGPDGVVIVDQVTLPARFPNPVEPILDSLSRSLLPAVTSRRIEFLGGTAVSIYAAPSNPAPRSFVADVDRDLIRVALMQRCATCRHWRPDRGGSSRRATGRYRGECVAFRPSYEHPGAVVYGDVETEADFGCTEHEPAPARPSEDRTP